jgi:DNA-binding transcriptional MerR regulator
MVELSLRPPLPPRRGTKSPEAFRTISEVADELDVPAHVLRFWEGKFKEIKPLKRGGGRRYYRPEDVDLLRSIRTLLYTQGYTIKGAQKFLRESGEKETQRASAPSPKPAQIEMPLGGLNAQQRRRLSAAASELERIRDLLRKRK